MLRSVKQAGTGYLAEVSGVEHPDWQKFTVKPIPSYGSGLVLFDSIGNIKWIIPANVLDYRMEGDTIWYITSSAKNSKTISSAELFLEKLDLKGNIISSKQIQTVDMKIPNARFNAVFDDSGNFWAWTTWSRSNEITFNDQAEVCATDTYYRMIYFDRTGNKQKHLDISGGNKPIKLDTWDASPSGTGFVFRGEAIQVENNRLIESPGLVLIMCDVNGNLKRTDQVAGPGVYAERLQLEESGVYLAATYQGMVNSTEFPATAIADESLTTAKSRYSDAPVRNVVVARFSPEMKLDWHEMFNCPTDIKFNSMSVAGNEIAVSLEYKDTLTVTLTAGRSQILLSWQTTEDASYGSDYSYSDDGLFFLHTNGKLEEAFPVKGRGSLYAELFENGLFLHGSFLNSLEFLDHELHYESKNSVYFLLFDK